jgi:hypothetical protein
MASIEDVGKSNYGYYTPEQKLVEGWYPVHVTRAKVTPPKFIRKSYKGKIYNIWFSISGESGYKVKSEGMEISTSQFKGKEVSNSGLFFFMCPEEDDDFKENDDGNKEYAEFLRACNIPLDKVEVNGQLRYYLPEVHPSAFEGKPLFAFIKRSKPFIGKNGDSIAPMQVRYVRAWSGGKPLEISEGLRLPI